MGRQKMGYCVVLMLIMSACNIISVENSSSLKTVLEKCECWSNPDNVALQVGKVVMHFTENPMIHPLPSTIYSRKNDHIFFIPTADVSDNQLRAIMDALKKNNNQWYSLSISREKKPIAGIKVIFSYDPQKVSIDHTLFDTLGTQKGIVFRLYNKSVIDAIKIKQNSSLLRVAMLKPSTLIV